MKKLLFILLVCFGTGLFAQKIDLNSKDSALLNQAFDAYPQMHQAFYQYSAMDVEKSAGKIADALGKIEDKDLAKKLKFSIETLKTIKSSKSEAENKNALHLVSMALIHLQGQYKVNKNYQSFYCPMVKKKWLQPQGEELMNPYSSAMPHCGEQISE